ncbi:MAG: T9SS type A sorting domain-containing protein, partial [Chitinophagales bacterium]|nr:T9SS type A sorting domain-containing protein [Chitinophagales bacterium]
NKLVDKPEVTPGFSGYLTYNINFENIGTGKATRVKVRDYLPHTLDFSTFEMLGASHPYTVNWSSDSIVEFVFYPIALTPKSIDSVHSHGHIWYRIKPLQPMAAGSYISNSAGIYFDDEDVVNTEACMVRAGQLHASFTITDTFQCGTERTVFRDQSPGTLFSRKWYFDGATPATATDKQPQVSYATTGTYKVTLVVTSRDYSDSLIQYVNVVVRAAPVATITASGPTTFCKGDSVTLTVNGNPGLTYVWNDGQTGNQVTLKSGYGYVIVSDSLGCKTSVYQPLTIGNPQPDISNTNGCENPVALLKLNTNFARRLWSTGDTTATITVNQYGAYRVTVTDAYGCQASDTFNFIFRAKPRPDIIGDTINCRFTTTNLSLTQVYTTYLWSNNTTTPVLKNISGNNTYRVTVTDQYGCVGSDTFIHRIYNSGSESIVEGLRDCSTRGYKVTTTGTNLRGLRWDTGDTTTVTYLKTPGNHSIAFTHNDGCVSTYSVNALVDYKYNLTARAYDTAFLCPGQNLQLSATYNKGALTAPSAGCTNANVATLGTGTFIENSSNTQPPAMFSNYKKGTRSAMLIKASELQTLLGGAKLITQVAYNIATLNSSAPLQNFSIRIAPTTLSQIYDFTPKYQMGEVYQATTVVPVSGWNTFTLTTPFYWDGSSNIIIDVNSFNPTTQGAVPNKVYCSNSGFGSYICAWDTFNLSNYNIATGGSSSGRPNIRFSYCTPVATAQPINSNNLTWSWYGNATVADTTAAYTQATLADSLVTFVVTVSDTFGCNETAVLSLPGRTINQLMINAGSGNLCAGGTVQLCATPGMNNYLWNIGATSACYTANTVGSYSVVAQDNRGCAGADTITLTAGNGGTVIHLTADKTTICPGEVANICAVGGAAGYQWNTSQITDCITANAPGIYTLNTSGGCVTADSITLQQRTVLPLNITATKTQLCPNESAQICINNVGGSYSWSTGGTTACITAGNAGVYKVAVVDANQCIATDSITIQTLTVQPLNITATKTQLCPNDSAQICINNVGGSYSWNTGGTAACITTSSAGVYKVAVVDANQCTATDSITIQQRTVLPLNIAATKTQLCPNDSAQICINNVGGSYSWSNGGTAACITAGNAGMYKVAVVDANQCTTLDSIEIQQAIITPVVITSLKTSLCGGDSITVCTAISSAGYLWNTQATAQCISVTDSGSYWVTATDLNTCTVESNHLTITKAALPVIIANSNILSTPASGTYQWYLNDTAIAGATTAAFTAVTSGNYKVLVTDTGGCQNYSNTLNVLYNGIVNTSTIKALQVKLYPNPFSTAFTMEIGNRNFKQVEFVLTNAIGQEILRDANTCFTDRFAKTFNLSALATGVYFVSTIVDGEKVVHRVVKE